MTPHVRAVYRSPESPAYREVTGKSSIRPEGTMIMKADRSTESNGLSPLGVLLPCKCYRVIESFVEALIVSPSEEGEEGMQMTIALHNPPLPSFGAAREAGLTSAYGYHCGMACLTLPCLLAVRNIFY